MSKVDEIRPFPEYKIIQNDNFSLEAYFGGNSALVEIMDKHNQILKDKLSDPNIKFKDKKTIEDLKNTCKAFGQLLADELNMESLNISLIATTECDASSLLLSAVFDNTEMIKDSSGIDVSHISLNKYIDIENIIQTSSGYKFKDKKNKLGLISVSVGMYQKLEVRQISAIICHEIGHMFQQGVFGSYKYYSDLIVYSHVKVMQDRFGAESERDGTYMRLFKYNSLLYKLFHNAISYFIFPNFLREGIFSKLGLFFYSHTDKRILDEKTFLMNEKSRRNQAIDAKTAKIIIANTIEEIAGPEYDRKKFITERVEDNYDELQIFKNENPGKKKKLSLLNRTRISLIKFFYSSAMFINAIEKNVLNLISLNSYTTSTYMKNVFYKKYEFFADIFASSYGYSSDMYKGLVYLDREEKEVYENIFKDHIFELPIFKPIMLQNIYSYNRKQLNLDVHGTLDQRIDAIYTSLMNELKSNPELTPQQKKDIQNSMIAIKTIDDAYYDDLKKGGFWYKFYDKSIQHRLSGKSNKSVEENILGPLKEVLKEVLKEEK